MLLDLSGPKRIAREFFRMSHDYQMHDPDLAAEISQKAHDICSEFDLDAEAVQKPQAPDWGLDKRSYMSQSDSGQADDETDQLHRILNRQKAIVEVLAIERGAGSLGTRL